MYSQVVFFVKLAWEVKNCERLNYSLYRHTHTIRNILYIFLLTEEVKVVEQNTSEKMSISGAIL